MNTLINQTRQVTKAKWLIYLLAVILSGCSRVVLVPDYSAGIEAEIVNGAMLNDKLYLDLADAQPSKREYIDFSERYSSVEAVINSIQLKNEIRQKNTDMLAIINNLKAAFTKYRDEHKKNNTLSDGEVKADQAFIKAFWKPLLIAEHGLKNAK
ncbi:hypothetical protein A0256_15405 [Mucilaginibacter sp. PAMC 26640]|nr:hypothetical protein A0256_15405 [Mucilaginibacter sp. PAMC 26640]